MTTVNLNDFSGVIWLNGEFISWQQAKIHALTHSLHYSGSVFEGERSYNYKIFKLEEHTLRLISSAKTMHLKIPFTFDQIYNACTEIVVRNNLPDAYIRPLVWRGSESMNLTNDILSINVLIAAIPVFGRSAKSLNVNISRWQKSSPKSLPPQCKSAAHYSMMIVSKEEAQMLGYDDSIILDYLGFVAECTTANIFFVKQNTLFTPIPDKFLNGITRQTIIEIARQEGLKVIEESISLSSMSEFDECFITGTAAEVKRIGSITLDNQKIIFENSRIFDQMSAKYADLVRK